jgi:hypothetical protein
LYRYNVANFDDDQSDENSVEEDEDGVEAGRCTLNQVDP